jgi:hypothetical protein
MALSPSSIPILTLTEDDRVLVKEVEDSIDSFLRLNYTEGFVTSYVHLDDLPEPVLRELIRLYREAGWHVSVVVHKLTGLPVFYFLRGTNPSYEVFNSLAM